MCFFMYILCVYAFIDYIIHYTSFLLLFSVMFFLLLFPIVQDDVLI